MESLWTRAGDGWDWMMLLYFSKTGIAAAFAICSQRHGSVLHTQPFVWWYHTITATISLGYQFCRIPLVSTLERKVPHGKAKKKKKKKVRRSGIGNKLSSMRRRKNRESSLAQSGDPSASVRIRVRQDALVSQSFQVDFPATSRRARKNIPCNVGTCWEGNPNRYKHTPDGVIPPPRHYATSFLLFLFHNLKTSSKRETFPPSSSRLMTKPERRGSRPN
ncbi:hypothetical protein LY78DRAFT_362108 [Colletotrichum sublineola]|nr:hypothetical protein LY78DRAFT_362108 [Colletotrichum sublineola]